MPDHVHWLFQLVGQRELSALVKYVKSISARDINRLRGGKGRVWQAGYHDHAVRKEQSLVAIARYIILNPVRAGLVKRVGDYPYWDAVWV